MTNSPKLQKAIDYEKEKAPKIPIDTKPTFHVTAPVGWINDPNGFSTFKGVYHLFFQYHPYDVHWGPMHWGHVKSKDFIKWEQLPCALAPDTEYDGQGCFSGSAIEDDGKHVLMYTSIKIDEAPDGTRRERQTQSIAIGDGVKYTKSESNPVITADMLPEGSSLVDFRDPKIWKDEDTYYVVIGSRNEDGSGQIVLFSSKDAIEWKFEKVLIYCRNVYGKMWECPDFFPLDQRHLLIVSPQQVKAKNLDLHNGNNALYFIGDFDNTRLEYTEGRAYEIDFGMDFYAPQTMQTPDGRRIMIAWLQNWDNYLTPESMQWSGIMTIPRELSIRNNKLIQNPIRELANYYGEKIEYQNVKIREKDGRITLENVKGRSFDMTITLQEGDFERFSILLASNEDYLTQLIYDKKKGIFTTDRTYSGMERDVLSIRSMQVENHKPFKIRVLIDKYTIEVFINDGEQAMTSLIYTPIEADDIQFECIGETEFTVIKHEIVL